MFAVVFLVSPIIFLLGIGFLSGMKFEAWYENYLNKKYQINYEKPKINKGHIYIYENAKDH